MNIIKKPSPNFGSRDGNTIKYICVHIGAASLSSIDNTFANPTSGVSASYGIGLNGDIHQYVEDENMHWCNGGVLNPTAQVVKDNLTVNQNKISLSIENEGFDLAKAPEPQLNALVDLIRSLATKYAIPLDRYHIIGHREITTNKSTCPSSDNTVLDNIVTRCQVVPPQNSVKQLVVEIQDRLDKIKLLI